MDSQLLEKTQKSYHRITLQQSEVKIKQSAECRGVETAIKSILARMNVTFKQIPQINYSHKMMPTVKKVSLLLFLHLCEHSRQAALETTV